MVFTRFVLRYKVTDEWLRERFPHLTGQAFENNRAYFMQSYDGAYHCLGCPTDPRDINNALLMPPGGLGRQLKANLRRSKLMYDLIPVTCTI